MQKLLRRSPSSSGPALFSAPLNASHPLPLYPHRSISLRRPPPPNKPHSSSYSSLSAHHTLSPIVAGIISRNSSPHSTRAELLMPASSAFQYCLLSAPPLSTNTAATTRRSKHPTALRRVVVGAGDFRVCRCSVADGCGSGRVVRPWAVPKEIRGGGSSCLAWLHTAAGGDDGSVSMPVAANENFGEQLETVGCEDEVKGKGTEPEEKPLKFQHRRRGGTGGGVSRLQESPDLLTIPGVGPRNLRKLVEKGIGKVAELKQLYRDKFLGKSSEKMVEYLQSSVGIVHKNHAESITTFIKESVDEELEDDGSGIRLPKKRITLCVEGNISVGKTTFLQRIANETLELQDLVEIVPEPVDKWQNIGPDHFNILDAFYAEPQRYAYTFQNYVFVTRVMQERESSGGVKPLRLMERSVFSDRMVFVRAVHEAKWMNEMEISIYDSWFDPVVATLPGLIPDGFIYLRASPDTCHKRMMLRQREEEGGVSLDYLHGLHEKHESWLLPFQSGNHGVLSVNKLPLSLDRSLHPDIRDRVFYLEGSHMHSSIQKVPALVLDCEPNIDFNRDVEAKKHYARQVAEFFEFVKKSKELDSPTSGDGTAKNPMPRPPGLWVPDSKQLLTMNPLDLSRRMSLFSG